MSKIDRARQRVALAEQTRQAAVANTVNNDIAGDKTTTSPSESQPSVDSLYTSSTHKKIDELLKKLDSAPIPTQSSIEQKIDAVLEKLDSNPTDSQTVTCPAIQSNIDTQQILDLLRNINPNPGSSTTRNTACTTDRVNELEQKLRPYSNIKEKYIQVKAAYDLYTARNNFKELLAEEKIKLESTTTQGMKPTSQKELRDKISRIDEALDTIEQDPNKGFYQRFYSEKKIELNSILKSKKDFANNDEIKKICEEHECFQSSKAVEITCAALHYYTTDEIN